MGGWNFLTSHGLLLGYLARHSQVTAREISLAIGITERAVRKIISDLAEAGYLEVRREGRCNRYEINPDLSLRHPLYEHLPVARLLQSLGWRRKAKSTRTR